MTSCAPAPGIAHRVSTFGFGFTDEEHAALAVAAHSQPFIKIALANRPIVQAE
jgi:hypothetical protein